MKSQEICLCLALAVTTSGCMQNMKELTYLGTMHNMSTLPRGDTPDQRYVIGRVLVDNDLPDEETSIVSLCVGSAGEYKDTKCGRVQTLETWFSQEIPQESKGVFILPVFSESVELKRLEISTDKAPASFEVFHLNNVVLELNGNGTKFTNLGALKILHRPRVKDKRPPGIEIEYLDQSDTVAVDLFEKKMPGVIRAKTGEPFSSVSYGKSPVKMIQYYKSRDDGI